MKKEVEINKIDLKVFYGDEEDYKTIYIILNAMEEENIILSWYKDNDIYEISYLNHDYKNVILENIKTLANEKLGYRTTCYKERGILTY